MSSSNKISSSRGNVKSKTSLGNNDHKQFVDASKCDKHQSRPAQNPDIHTNSKEDMAWQERIKHIMELTSRSEDEVVMALHDSDGDLNRAVNDLLEGVSPEWEVKKKKARQTAASKSNSEQTGVSDCNTDWDNKCLTFNDGPSRSRGRANHNNRGWRRRENKENEKINEDSKFDNESNYNRRSRISSGRSTRGGRGGGRGSGPRTFANRGEPSKISSTHNFSKPIETWTGKEQEKSLKDSTLDSWNPIDASEDWDNEEYTGSLADTKVFTPSTATTEVIASTEQDDKFTNQSCPVSHSTVINNPSKIPAKGMELQDPSCQQIMSTVHLSNPLNNASSRSLSTAQSEYFTQLSERANDCLSIPAGQSTFVSVITDQPQKPGKQRPRVPPPSKIPSSAVEMPGDTLNTSISYLDVQFGALEFGSDPTINDGSNQDKYVSSESHKNSPNVDCTNDSTKHVASSIHSLNVESAQITSQPLNPTTEMLHTDHQSAPDDRSNAQSGFTNRNTNSQTVDVLNQEIKTTLSMPSSYNAPVTYQSSAKYSTSGTNSDYSTYSCTAQPTQTNFTTSTTSCNSTFSVISPSVQSAYGSSYNKPNTFSQSPASCAASSMYNQTSTTSQAYQKNSGFTTPISQYQSQTAPSAVISTNSTYITGGYQNSASFQSTVQSYQPTNNTFTSSTSQGSTVYPNTASSVYSNTYPSYVSQNHQGPQDNKLLANKDLPYETNTATNSTSMVTTSTSNLSLSSSSVGTSSTKATITNVTPKSGVSGLTPSNSNSSTSNTGSGTSGNVAPILSHQYIMGQSVPYATFQQPHMYSYEDLQLIQQRIPHMPTTGYYDATLGYQTTGPVTSLGNSRNDTLSGVQSVQGVQTVQAQYTNMNDARFTRTDSNASPVSSTISQQTTQHQQPLINPIPPGYAYFYGGGIMPASGFQYGTPAIYPQIATAGNAGSSTGTYTTKPTSYSSAYGGGASYDTLSSSGSSGDYKHSTSGYSNNQNKNGSSNSTSNAAGSSSDISSTMYSKGHVTLSKVNSYEKQNFHSATPPPFGLTNNQNANVIGGYGAAHLFIPTVPHQLHQAIHQDSSSSTGQRTNSNSQNKAQVKSGYNASYWTGGN